MNPISCPHEESITHSARTGRWEDSAKAHVAECAHCREIVRITESLERISGADAEERELPEPEQIWFRGRILAAQAAREKAIRRLLVIELGIRAALILFLAAGITWTWFRVQSLAAHWAATHLPLPQPILYSAAAMATCLVALLFVKLFQPILTEE
jgi:predicted anti-sigma-YlaC factor YlaD